MVGIPGGGHRYEFAPGQLERARVLNALHRKGVSLGQLVAADLAFYAGQAYVVYDGRELRACRDAAAAIATVVSGLLTSPHEHAGCRYDGANGYFT